LGDAERAYYASDYDPEHNYAVYLYWEKPEDYDSVIGYLETCEQDANVEDCAEDCLADPT
jgi:hypothetical protein